MLDSLNELISTGDIWSILIRVLLTATLSATLGLIVTVCGRMIARNKHSKIRRYAKICVEAAELKFPNEGKKMGPEKMSYVMDQLAIKFPKIRENTYLYNIVEAAVYEINKDRAQCAAIEEFELKYGEKPLAVKEQEEDNKNTSVETPETSDIVTEVSANEPQVTQQTVVKVDKLLSF